jgi:sec-independent protein translocase protein TatB
MDSFFGIGLFELVMIAVVALLVMGPERLPGAMREVAKYMRQLRNISNEFQAQFSDELKMLDEMDPRKIINGALDPNSTASPPAAATTPKAATAPAKPPAAKPLAPKPVTTATPAKPSAATPPATPVSAPPETTADPAADPPAAPAITNGEPHNSILPPPKSQPSASEPSASHPSPVAAPELAPESLPPIGAKPPADVNLPPNPPPPHQNGSDASE